MTTFMVLSLWHRLCETSSGDEYSTSAGRPPTFALSRSASATDQPKMAARLQAFAVTINFLIS